MKLTLISKAAEARYNRLAKWHRWFAWRPIRVAENDIRWLEWVDRRGVMLAGWDQEFWDWSYRAPDNCSPSPRDDGRH